MRAKIILMSLALAIVLYLQICVDFEELLSEPDGVTPGEEVPVEIAP